MTLVCRRQHGSRTTTRVVVNKCQLRLKYRIFFLFFWQLNRDSPEEETKKEGEEGKTDDSKAEGAKKLWTRADFATEYRKFNIDTTPKVSWQDE